MQEDGVENRERQHLQRDRDALLLLRERGVFDGADGIQEIQNGRGARAILATELDLGVEHEAAPLRPPLLHCCHVPAVVVDNCRAHHVVARTRAYRVGDPVRHGRQPLLPDVGVLEELADDSAAPVVSLPQPGNLVDVRDLVRGHVLEELRGHRVAEYVVHGHVALARLVDKALHALH